MMKKMLLTSLSFSVALAAFGQSEGFLTTYQKLLQEQHKQNKRLTTAILTNRNRVRDLKSVKDVKLNPIFLRNILVYSDKKYLDLIGHDECTFYSLLSTNILRTAEGTIDNILVDYLDNFDQWATAFISKNEYLQYVYKNKCQANSRLEKQFERNRLVQGIKTVKWNTPQTDEQCQQIWKNWRKDPALPFICNIPETIDWGKKADTLLNNPKSSMGASQKKKLQYLQSNKQFLLNQIGLEVRTYTTNLCQNIDSAENFCSLYLQKDVWSKIIKENRNTWKMKYLCQRFVNSQADPLNFFTKCRDLINKKPSLCATQITEDLPALYPRNRCDQISDALNPAHLMTDYQDCPGKIDNEGITNTFRILSHFNPELGKISEKRSCQEKVNEVFAKMAIESENSQAWPMELCYTDRIDKSEVCLPYIPNDQGDSDLSETKIIAKVLEKTRGASPKLSCSFIETNEFRPELLQYKAGCYILRNSNNCTTLHCPKDIRYNGQRITDIRYKGIPTFDYFTNNLGTEKYSIVSILEEKYKIVPTLVTNLTEIRFFLNLSPHAIIHGIGCAEALYPATFLKQTLNQCTPLPFIVDALIEGAEGKAQVSLRTAIDDIHSPTLVDWKRVFNAVSSYRNIHPTNMWALYGIKK